MDSIALGMMLLVAVGGAIWTAVGYGWFLINYTKQTVVWTGSLALLLTVSYLIGETMR